MPNRSGQFPAARVAAASWCDVARPAAVDCVRCWPGLSAAAKLAWEDLFRATRGGREDVCLTRSQVVAPQGTSEDAGRRALDALAAEGLVQISSLGRGVYRIAVLDPFVEIRSRPQTWDGQRLMEFAREEQREKAGKETSIGLADLSPTTGHDALSAPSATGQGANDVSPLRHPAGWTHDGPAGQDRQAVTADADPRNRDEPLSLSGRRRK